ncbi:MAG: diguanylate cyclase, partial [Fidelibacterota bacterium]
RAAFGAIFERMRSFANRVGAPLCIAMIDLDNFKSVNDTYGRTMGDEVLKRVAFVMSRSLRRYDSVCRWGGEKFVVLLPNTDISGGVRATEKVLLAVSEERFTPAEGKPFFVTFSAGVLRVHQKAPMEDAISEAEGLLYRAKSDGGNRVASPEVGTDSAREKILLADDDKLIVNIVRHRLEKEGLVVHSFPDGISALENAEEIMADLAILDVKMPGMDGFELLRRLRMLPPYARTPIIMLTSMGREQDIVRGFKLGADDYVLKPFSVVELLARVYRLLSVGKGASQD